MSLWYDCGNGWAKTSFARKDLGADLFLCCPGPSLADVDPADLQRPGAFVMAVNTAYPRISPQVWVGMDRPECYDHRLWWEPFVKIVRGNYNMLTCGGRRIRECPNTFFADCTAGTIADIFHRREHDLKLVWRKNTFVAALHYAVWIGARRIRLVGCDFGGKADYHDGRTLTDDKRKYNRQLYDNLLRELPHYRDFARRYGIDITSCTPDSPANEHLGYIPLEVALEEAGERVPKSGEVAPLHAVDAERCNWPTSKPIAPKGIVVGTDAKQEWMLTWWWSHYSRHNKFPVAFADFGMSDAAKKWCRSKGRLIDCTDVGLSGWFLKPFAILRAPFERIAWLDTDCEVRKPLGELFDFAERGFAVTRDPHTRICGPNAVAAGVVCVKRGEPLVPTWATMLLVRSGEFRDDQVCLNTILDSRPQEAIIMPPKFQRLRLDKFEDPDAVIKHWTGPAGRTHIRDYLASLTPSKSRVATSLPST